MIGETELRREIKMAESVKMKQFCCNAPGLMFKMPLGFFLLQYVLEYVRVDFALLSYNLYALI